jgi:ligand-binding sensor domain-containing protein
MKNPNYYITIITLLICNFSFSQHYINYSTKNGLPSNHIYRITQDYNGFIWFLTDNGIVKFNGNEFKTFTTKQGLPSNDIWDYRITQDNKFWFFTKATELGYIKNDTVYSFKNSEENKILYPFSINQSSNKVAILDTEKTYHLIDSLWQPTLGLSILNKKYKRLKYKNNFDSIILYSNNKKQEFSLKNKLKGKIEYRGQINDSLYCWITNNNILLLNLNILKFYSIATTTDKFLLTRFNLSNNIVQFTGKNYVAILGKKNKFSEYIKIPKKFNSHFSFIDKNDNLWIATTTNGVYFLPSASRYAKYQFENEKTGKINMLNKNIITSVHNKGFYKYNKKTSTFKKNIPLKNYMYSATYIEPLSSYYYLSNINAIQIKNKNKKIFNNFDKSRVLVFYKGNLYGNSSNFLNKINSDNFNLIKSYNQVGIRDLLVFNNQILLATANGLKTFKNDKIQTIVKINNFKKPIVKIEKLSNKEIIICTEGFGAYTTDLNKISPLEKSEYLVVNNAFLSKNSIYLATNKGIWKYKKNQNNYTLTDKITTKNGLNSNNIRDLYIKNDTLFASSNNGISIIDLTRKIKPSFINIFIKEANFNNIIITEGEKVSYKKNNQLIIKTSILDFTPNSDITYQYQLKPIQKEWNTTQSKQISFSDLPPNNYTFIIKKENKTDTVNFTVTPLWHQTWWAKLMIRLSLLALIIGIIFYFRKKETDKQKQKLIEQKKLAEYELHALRSQMNPHFVFNSLNAIQYYITQNNTDLSEKYLVRFSRLIRMFFDFSREKEISLPEEIKLLDAYLEIEKMRFGKDFNYKINIINNTSEMENLKIPTMILQPIVENAVNHGLFHNKGKGLIVINFEILNKNNFKVTVSDDGVGIKKSQEIQQKSIHIKKKNNSSNVIKERIKLLNRSKKWNISYKIIEKEKGTTVILNFKKNEFN